MNEKAGTTGGAGTDGAAGTDDGTPMGAAEAVVTSLAEANLVDRARIIMEKPFGTDLASARKLANDYPRYKRICGRHGIEISATRVRNVVQHFEAAREPTRAWRKILEQTTSTLLRQSAQQ